MYMNTSCVFRHHARFECPRVYSFVRWCERRSVHIFYWDAVDETLILVRRGLCTRVASGQMGVSSFLSFTSL